MNTTCLLRNKDEETCEEKIKMKNYLKDDT